MRSLQIGIALVLGVAAAIVVERRDERAGVLTDSGAVRAVFVDIVPVVEDERQLLVGEVAIGGVIACLVILAARDPEAEF